MSLIHSLNWFFLTRSLEVKGHKYFKAAEKILKCAVLVTGTQCFGEKWIAWPDILDYFYTTAIIKRLLETQC